MKYPLAKDGVYFSAQGEAHLRGFLMAFTRLAGCSVNCRDPLTKKSNCDTDYGFDSMSNEIGIADMVEAVFPIGYRDRWVWITGGEPYDHNLDPLIKELKNRNCSVAVATSGVHRAITPVDWLSVSYHGGDKPLKQMYGSELKLTDGLNGFDISTFHDSYPDSQTDFMYKYVQPFSHNGDESRASLNKCLEFLGSHPNWALSRQDHLVWDMP